MNGAPTASGQLLRERVLTALEHFWCPLRVEDELRPYLEGIWHQPVATDAPADLLAAEDRRRRQQVAQRLAPLLARRLSCLAATHQQGDSRACQEVLAFRPIGHGDRTWSWMVSGRRL